MKTFHIFFILFLIPCISFGQKNQSIDFVAGFDYTYRSLHTDSNNEDLIGTIGVLNENESPRANWRAGFNYNKRLNNKIFIKTGLRLASLGYNGKENTGLIFGSQLDIIEGSNMEVDPDLPSEVQFNTNYWFSKIPIALRFEFNEKKWSPFVEFGLAPSIYLTTRKQQITNLDSSTMSFNETALGLNRFHLVGFASFGLNYTLNDKLQLFGQPSFRYHLTTLADTPLNEHLYSVGIELGVRKKF